MGLKHSKQPIWAIVYVGYYITFGLWDIKIFFFKSLSNGRVDRVSAGIEDPEGPGSSPGEDD